MPELPEVETVRRQLATALGGAVIARVAVTGARSVRRQPAEEFIRRMRGREVSAVERWGKFLFLDLGDAAAVVHLRMSGRLALSRPEDPTEPHTHVVLTLSTGRELRFVDPRTFGEWYVDAGRDARGLPASFAHLGADPVLTPLTPEALAGLGRGRRCALKTLLTDQRAIAGIGNIYADEICAAARVRPTRVAGRVRRAEWARLAGSISDVLADAVIARGSTLADARYRDLTGAAGTYQLRHRVYGRAGEPCGDCGAAIRRAVVAGRSAHWCPHCQR